MLVKKKEKCPMISLLVISDVAQINHTLCERGKMNKKANAVDAVAATNADERAILRARIFRRFAVGFLLNTAFLSYAFSFASSIRDTRLLPRYSFPSSYMHAECSIRKITTEFRRCHRKAWNMKLLTSKVIRFSDIKKKKMHDMSCTTQNSYINWYTFLKRHF